MGQARSRDYAVVVEGEGDDARPVGSVVLCGTDTLADARRAIDADGVPTPTDYQFVLPNGAPASGGQEAKRSVSESCAIDDDDRATVMCAGKEAEPRIVLRAGPLDGLRRCLGPLHRLDDSLVEDRASDFVDGTRRWVFEAFEEWVSHGGANSRSRNSRAFVLSGEAGVGKTGIACVLARDRTDVVVARHFCHHDDARRSDPRAMLLSIAFQLAESIPEYRVRLVDHVDRNGLTREKLMGSEYDTVSLFAELFQALLRDTDVRGSLDGREGNAKRRVILIDAIDECQHDVGMGRNGILECIRKHFKDLPSWMGVFITTRPELPIKEKLRLFNPIEIEPEMENNLSDLRIFFNALFKDSCLSKRLKGLDKARAIETLVKKSKGLFIHAVMTADALKASDERITQEMLDLFPDGLDGFYQEQMERTFPEAEQSLAWDMVKFIVAAAEPLDIKFMTTLTGRDEDECRAAIRELSRFFPVRGGKIQLYHKSLKDWLVSADRNNFRHHVNIRDAEERLARACLAVLKEAGVFSGQAGIRPTVVDETKVGYPLRNAVRHLYSVGLLSEARNLVLDVGWLVVRAEMGDSIGMLSDCHLLSSGDRVMELLARSLSLAQNVLRKDPRQLASQLVGRLTGPASPGWLGGESPDVRMGLNDLLERVKLYDFRRPWWCPVSSTWDQANTPCVAVLAGQCRSIRCVKWSKDGRNIISGAADGSVCIWDAASGECLHALGGEKDVGKINSIALSNDGTRFACAHHGIGKVRLFNIETGKQKDIFSKRKIYGCLSVAFSPDDLYIAIGGAKNVLICDINLDDAVAEMKTNKKVDSVAFSRLGDRLAFSTETSIKIFGVRDYKSAHRELEGHRERINSLEWSNEDKYILSGSEDYKVRVWDSWTGKCLRILKGRMAEWSHDCEQVVSATKFGIVSIFDSEDERTHVLRGHTSAVLSVTWCPDGKRVASGGADQTIRIFDVTRTVIMQKNDGHGGYITSKSWSYDGKYLVTGSVDQNIRVWDASLGETIHILTDHTGRVTCVDCSGNSHHKHLIASGSSDKTIRIWNLLSGVCMQTLKGHKGAVRSVAWASDVNLLASGSAGGNIRIWDVNSGTCIQVLSDQSNCVENIWSLAWSRDQTALASASGECSIMFWDVNKGKCVNQAKVGAGNVWFLVFSDDDKYVMTAFKSNFASFVNVQTGECFKVIGRTNLHLKLSQLHFSTTSTCGISQISDEDPVGVDFGRFHSFGNKACSIEGSAIHFFTLFQRHRNRSGANKITFLRADPLVYEDMETGQLCPLPRLDFPRERQLMRQCFADASRDIELCFDVATTRTLNDAGINQVDCLHLSGHGSPNYLLLENGQGGAHILDDVMLKELYPCQSVTQQLVAPHKLVFICACHSSYLAEVFVDAGVGSVVCCQHDEELEDEAAAVFMRSFYLALAVGHTVKVSFEMGRQAVASGPFISNPSHEKEKFVLLPKGGDHDKPIIFARPVKHWLGKGTQQQLLLDMTKVDSNDQVDMFKLLDLISQHQFVSLIGMSASVRSKIASATCHYIRDRASEPEIGVDVVLCLPESQQVNGCECSLSFIYGQLFQGKKGEAGNEANIHKVGMMQEIIDLLQHTCVLVFVMEGLKGEESGDFFVKLIQMSGHLKVLRTGDQRVTIPSLQEKEQVYELESFSAG